MIPDEFAPARRACQRLRQRVAGAGSAEQRGGASGVQITLDMRSIAALSIGVFASSVAAGNDADYAQRLAALVNEYRISHGLRVLAGDRSIADLAREHSDDMAKAGTLNHDGFPSRVSRAGGGMCVENCRLELPVTAEPVRRLARIAWP
jgi:uncharacterized protein YkwD